jgi:hypothetical protein
LHIEQEIKNRNKAKKNIIEEIQAAYVPEKRVSSPKRSSSLDNNPEALVSAR